MKSRDTEVKEMINMMHDASDITVALRDFAEECNDNLYPYVENAIKSLLKLTKEIDYHVFNAQNDS